MERKRERGRLLMMGIFFLASVSISYGLTPSGPIPVGSTVQVASSLWSPGKVAVDSSGGIYVVDGYRDRIQVYSAKGEQQGSISIQNPSAVAVGPGGSVYAGSHKDYSVSILRNGAREGYLGRGPGEFLSIRDIAIDEASGHVYVADAVGNAVRVYDAAGQFVKVIAGFEAPAAIAVRGSELYVLDAPSVELEYGGRSTGSRVSVLDASGTVVRSFGEYGGANARLERPSDIAVDSDGTIFITDTVSKAVLVYDGSGVFLGTITSAAGAMHTAVSLAFADDGRLYVSSSESHNIVEIGLAGALESLQSGTVEFQPASGAAEKEGRQ